MDSSNTFLCSDWRSSTKKSLVLIFEKGRRILGSYFLYFWKIQKYSTYSLLLMTPHLTRLTLTFGELNHMLLLLSLEVRLGSDDDGI